MCLLASIHRLNGAWLLSRERESTSHRLTTSTREMQVYANLSSSTHSRLLDVTQRRFPCWKSKHNSDAITNLLRHWTKSQRVATGSAKTLIPIWAVRRSLAIRDTPEAKEWTSRSQTTWGCAINNQVAISKWLASSQGGSQLTTRSIFSAKTRLKSPSNPWVNTKNCDSNRPGWLSSAPTLPDRSTSSTDRLQTSARSGR